MRRVYLIGEDHSTQGKNLVTLGLLKMIEQEAQKPILAISFELEQQYQEQLSHYRMNGHTDFNFICHFAKKRKIPLFASDNRDFPVCERQSKLEEMLQKKSNPELINEYRTASRQSNIAREEYMSKKLSSYFHDKEGIVIHIGGMSHLHGLRERLQKDAEVRFITLRDEQQLKYTKGNILYTLANTIAHGVAAQDIEDMGTGLAKQIREKWPESFARFKKMRRASFKPGDVIIDYESTPFIAYLATQPDLYHAEERYVNKALGNLRKQLEADGIASCALPKIGCGYGKLDWTSIKPMIERKLSGSTTEFIIYEKFTA